MSLESLVLKMLYLTLYPTLCTCIKIGYNVIDITIDTLRTNTVDDDCFCSLKNVHYKAGALGGETKQVQYLTNNSEFFCLPKAEQAIDIISLVLICYSKDGWLLCRMSHQVQVWTDYSSLPRVFKNNFFMSWAQKWDDSPKEYSV